MSFNSNDKFKIYRAGIIPYFVHDNGVIEMLFMKPANTSFGADIDPITFQPVMRYQLAKGRIENGENSEQAAIREGGEETGLKEDNIIQILHVGTFLGRTEVYIAKIKDKNDFAPHDYETESTKWFTIDEFRKDGRSLHLDLVEKSHIIMDINEQAYGSYRY